MIIRVITIGKILKIMKKLTLLLIILTTLASCNRLGETEYQNVDNNFDIQERIVFYKKVEIGKLDAIKLEKEGNLVKKEISIVLENSSENYELAPRLIEWMTHNNRFQGTDIEIKFRY